MDSTPQTTKRKITIEKRTCTNEIIPPQEPVKPRITKINVIKREIIPAEVPAVVPAVVPAEVPAEVPAVVPAVVTAEVPPVPQDQSPSTHHPTQKDHVQMNIVDVPDVPDVPNVPDAPDVPDEPEEESVYDLHPQLQLILQYLADTDHVTLVDKAEIQLLHQKVDLLNDMVTKQTDTLKQIIESQSSIKALCESTIQQVVPQAVPQADPQAVTQAVTQAVPPTVPQAVPQAEPTVPQVAPQTTSSMFQATFILDLTGKGQAVAQALKSRGFNNCIILNTVAPKNSSAKVHMTYCLDDILNITEKRGYKYIHVLTDSILIHKKFNYIIDYLSNDLRQDNWKILQYLCTKHNYGKMDFDWQFYSETNPVINSRICDETRASHHWKHKGSIREGRVAKGSIVPTTSTDTLAFGLNLTNQNFMNLLKQHVSASRNSDVSFMDGLTEHLSMVCPNLFITDGTGAKVGKAIKWVEENYEKLT